MTDFWLWFTRPLAELAGGLALLAVVFLFMVAVFLVMVAYHWVCLKLDASFPRLFDPKKKLQRQYERKLSEAHDAMNKRGDRALHAKLTAEAEVICKQIEAL